MRVIVKLTPNGDPIEMTITNVVEFLDRYPDAQVLVREAWVPFDKKYPVFL